MPNNSKSSETPDEKVIRVPFSDKKERATSQTTAGRCLPKVGIRLVPLIERRYCDNTVCHTCLHNHKRGSRHQLGLYHYASCRRHEKRRNMARHRRHFLPYGGQCALRFPFGNNERHLHARICKERKACKIHTNDDQQSRGHTVNSVRSFRNVTFVNFFGFGDSILAGSLTLGLLALPLVIRTTEEALKAIPDTFREGSLALGATKLQTIRRVILPMAMPNVITGLILALGRVSGETAPILFTCAAYFLPQLPESVFDQCMALPYHLYVLATSGTDMELQIPIAYGTALVLIVIILAVNLLANAMRNYFQNKLKTN